MGNLNLFCQNCRVNYILQPDQVNECPLCGKSNSTGSGQPKPAEPEDIAADLLEAQKLIEWNDKPASPREAWLHRANDNYYTAEQFEKEFTGSHRKRAEDAYIRFIEKSAYDAVCKERDDAASLWKIQVGANDKLRAELTEQTRVHIEVRKRDAEMVGNLRAELAETKELLLSRERWVQRVSVDYEELRAEHERRGQVIDSRNEEIFALSRELTPAREVHAGCADLAIRCDAALAEVERYKGLQKDHEDDWKRIQDAEREVERLTDLAAVTDETSYRARAVRWKDELAQALERVRELEKEIESLKDQLQWSLRNEEQYKRAMLEKKDLPTP